MAATATSIIHWNAIPVFADIDKKNFCINPKEIKKKITNKTVAILAVDIFGNSCDIKGIKNVIKGTKIKIITDSAQSPYSVIKEKITGTQSHIGGFSLNYHKHINTGEGGIIVTNNSILARRARLIRNHAETSLKNKTKKQLSNMIGYNFRMGEVEAAIGIEQYKKIKKIIKTRNFLINLLTLELRKLPGLTVPISTKNYEHNYYVYPLVLDFNIIKYSRNFIYKCLKAEGVQGLNEGYANIHLLPMYQKKIAYGENGFPWSNYNPKIDYKKGLCPVAEELHHKSFLGLEVCLFQLYRSDILNITSAFKKVWKLLKIS
jgi:dTDP-4-amino-4,6-dideoxygalactose transaminase